MAAITEFEIYQVTNGHAGFGTANATAIGCTGSLEVEPDTKTVTKKCEGVTTDEVQQVVGLTVNFSGHVKVDVLRNVWGLDTTDLKAGVWSYGVNSRGKRGVYTWEAYDMRRETKKFIAFPELAATTGLRWKVENGGDEVAEVEIEFRAFPDANGNFYYEAFESELTDTVAKTTWMTKFTPALVKGA